MKRYPILVVDDERIVRQALVMTLSLSGFEVDEAEGCIEAIQKLHTRPYAVIVTDQNMPDMSGLELFDKAKSIQPHATRVLVTGVLTLDTVVSAINRGEIYRFLAKPWLNEELVATVTNGYQRFEMGEENRSLLQRTRDMEERLRAYEEREAGGSSQLQVLKERVGQAEDRANAARQRSLQAWRSTLDFGLALLEARDPALGLECRNAVKLAKRIASSGELDQRSGQLLVDGACLMNLGLVGLDRDRYSRARHDLESVDEALANFPTHSQALASYVSDDKELGRVIRAAHERWDGHGYPDGLARENIPFAARLLAIIAFFVECGLPEVRAISAIAERSGTAFEPELVRLFSKLTRLIQLPANVSEVLMADLHNGMVLATDLVTPSGLLLLPAKQRLDEETIAKVRRHDISEPITQRILVYSNSIHRESSGIR